MRRVSQQAMCATDLVLDEWSSGELDELTSARVAEHVARCERCSARHANLEAVRQAFLAESPSFRLHSARFGAPPARTAAVRSSWRERHWEPIKLALASLATAAFTATIVVWVGPGTEPPAASRTKGTAHVDFFVKRGSQVRRGQRGDSLAPGDALRFTYTNPERSYFALFNLDAQAASVYFPSAARAAPLQAGSQVALDFSVELDAQLGQERVFGVFCPEPFELEPLRAALAANRSLPERPRCQVDEIPILKVPAR
ncbi:MAG TPA: DUF4384 domain-containing protein [Polyangiales bacterium]|nr:DUF4384 domain-containing protein [Polyangiales bacterium]